eukprot:CAMPEP_0172874286 /NCGR_PEP_ID=MMETSP1075-20121228/97702_1 /TAXON_ID=2916 /ORGANISM="Ceratium fusus, Strain PA161109" /LENGTH=37 /DNA_ID= /DNA_START= /DNA_END= /DNA_ORIENTATION=
MPTRIPFNVSLNAHKVDAEAPPQIKAIRTYLRVFADV